VPVVESPATISWRSTMEPFARELPLEAGWIRFVSVASSDAGDDLAKSWTRRDEVNDVLKRELDVEFVRDLVIKHANSDFAIAATGGVAISVDALHGAVARARLDAGSGWHIQGFALPILFPYVPDASWDVIASLRADRNLVAFRRILSEIEHDILEVLGGSGDLEAAVHHAYERKLSAAHDRIERLGASIRREVVALGVGVGGGVVALPLSPPLGLSLGALPSVVWSTLAIRTSAKRRAQRAWVAFDWRLRQP
jgi:hypothetical protein